MVESAKRFQRRAWADIVNLLLKHTEAPNIEPISPFSLFSSFLLSCCYKVIHLQRKEISVAAPSYSYLICMQLINSALRFSFVRRNGKLHHATFLSVRIIPDFHKAFMPVAARQAEREMHQKGYARPVFRSSTSTSRPLSEATEMYETEFEEDLSDSEEYSGRRSEESVSRFDRTSCIPN